MPGLLRLFFVPESLVLIRPSILIGMASIVMHTGVTPTISLLSPML